MSKVISILGDLASLTVIDIHFGVILLHDIANEGRVTTVHSLIACPRGSTTSVRTYRHRKYKIGCDAISKRTWWTGNRMMRDLLTIGKSVTDDDSDGLGRIDTIRIKRKEERIRIIKPTLLGLVLIQSNHDIHVSIPTSCGIVELLDLLSWRGWDKKERYIEVKTLVPFLIQRQ